jgi:hypothetical protein
MSEGVKCLKRHGKFLPFRKNVNQFVEALMTLNDWDLLDGTSGFEGRIPGFFRYPAALIYGKGAASRNVENIKENEHIPTTT